MDTSNLDKIDEPSIPEGSENLSLEEKMKLAENSQTQPVENLEEAITPEIVEPKIGEPLIYDEHRLVRGTPSFGVAEPVENASEELIIEKPELNTVNNEVGTRERIKVAGKKFIQTIGNGAGAKLLSGLTEHIADDIESEVNAQVPEKLFEDPSILIHEVVADDSLWKIIGKILENNERFKGMTEAQKTYVLSNLTNKVLQNPENYGLNKVGSLNIGDKTDFTKLFENTKEVSSIFEKAEQTVAQGSPQESSILEQEAKIKEWIKNNPDARLSSDKIAEILNTKPKVEEVAPVEDLINTNNVEVPVAVPVVMPIPEPVPEVQPEAQPETNNVSEMQREIEAAKERLKVLEGGKGMRTMSGDISAEQGVEKAFRDEINSIYEQSGFLGLNKVPGINTKEWGEMAKLPAAKVVEYYTGDSAKSGLSDEILEKLAKSKNHNALMRQTAGLMEQADGAVKPFENENMEQFIRRLGGYVLKTYSQNSSKNI